MKTLLIILFMVVYQNGSNEYLQKLQLEVYYESRCPDSIKFITQQLVPTVDRLRDYLKVTLVPFGKAHSINNVGDFECQHGPSECRGNKVQDCTLNIMRDQSDVEKVAYVNCEMERLAAAKGSYLCVQEAGISVARVDSCVNSDEGTKLQLYSEYVTKQLKPRFIPTITINGVFDQDTQDNALRDLTLTLCSMMSSTIVRPCANYYFI